MTTLLTMECRAEAKFLIIRISAAIKLAVRKIFI